MARSTHGTATNSTSTQTITQRAAIDRNSNLGRYNRTNIFNENQFYTDVDTVANRFFEYVSAPQDLTTSKPLPDSQSYNPDFKNQTINKDYMTFRSENNKFSKVTSQSDKPNLHGPNIIVDENLINNQELEVENRASSPTQDLENFNSNGFGITIDRNIPNTQAPFHSFLQRRARLDGSVGTKLGEYINGPEGNDPYEYEE